MKRLIIAALAIVAMAGCTKDLDGVSGGNSAVSFTIGDIVESRAEIKSAWSEDGSDRVGIYTTDDTYINIEYSVGTNGILSPEGTTTIHYTSQDSPTTFFTYYPYDATCQGSVVSVDVSDQSKMIDLLVSDRVSDTQIAAKGVTFSFSHTLSAVEITIADSDLVDLSTMKVYSEAMVSNATYDLVAEADNITLGTTTSVIDFDIAPIEGDEDGSYLARAIVLPNDYTATKVYFKFTDVKGVTHLYEQTLNRAYASGYKYTYDANIGADYGVSMTIENELAWEDTVSPDGVTSSKADIVYDSSDDKFHIYSAKGLRAFSDLVNGSGSNTCGALLWGEESDYDFTSKNLDADALLMADVDLSEVCGAAISTNWSPIGNYESSSDKYSGTFDGGGYTISNLYVYDTSNSNSYPYGLFGATSGATLQNITLEGVDIKASANCGALIGRAYNSNISNCHVFGSLTGIGSSCWIGGFIGQLYIVDEEDATILNCSNSADVTVIGGSWLGLMDSGRLGGLIGYCSLEYNNTVTIANCYNMGNIDNDTSGDSTGGFIGYCYMNQGDTTITITNCYNHGEVTPISDDENSYNSGSIIGYYYDRTNDITAVAELINCYYLEGTNIVGARKTVESGYYDYRDYTTIDCDDMTDEEMKGETFVTTLNTNAAAITDAYGWVAVADLYPVLDPTKTPQASDSNE